MDQLRGLDLVFERLDQRFGQQGAAFIGALWRTYDDLMVAEVNIFDPQAQAFPQP